MDYEKKYKDALKRAEKALEVFGTDKCEGARQIFSLFPELKESEDERVRKGLLKAVSCTFKGNTLYGTDVTREQAITWLEKQGEQKSIWHNEDEEPKIDSLILLIMQSGTPIVAKIIEPNHTFNHGERWAYIDDLLEEQDGQKSSDKIEPKFHEGEWITNGDYTWKIVEVKPLDYILQSQDGNIVDDTISHVDEQFHSFTIEDAKDGDVLVAPPIKGQEGKEQIFIFKGINNRNYVDNCIEYYCRVYEGVFYENENDCGYMGTTSSPIYPATKSQRDTLFTKMKEAGYEWNSEKRELKKNSQRMISAEAKEAMYDKPTNNDMKEALRTEYEKGRADVLRCIDSDEMVADFCSQPLSKTRSIASVYRQGIIDILKRINSNEENSITGTCSIDNCGL